MRAVSTSIQITIRPSEDRHDASGVEVHYPEFDRTLGRYLVSHRELSKFLGIAHYLALLATVSDETGRTVINEEVFVETNLSLAELADESLA